MVDRTYKGPGGLIVRTAAHGAKKSDFVREIDYLHKLNEVLERRTAETKAPNLVFQEADLPVRVLRDVFLSDFEKAIIDSGSSSSGSPASSSAPRRSWSAGSSSTRVRKAAV